MEQKDPVPKQSNDKTVGKKPYRTPSLEVLGKVEELTRSAGYPGGGCGCTPSMGVCSCG